MARSASVPGGIARERAPCRLYPVSRSISTAQALREGGSDERRDCRSRGRKRPGVLLSSRAARRVLDTCETRAALEVDGAQHRVARRPRVVARRGAGRRSRVPDGRGSRFARSV